MEDAGVGALLVGCVYMVLKLGGGAEGEGEGGTLFASQRRAIAGAFRGLRDATILYRFRV